MPCSRSARRPSVSRARSVSVPPRGRSQADRFQLILEDPLGVVQQATDQRRLAVVDIAGRRQAEQLSH